MHGFGEHSDRYTYLVDALTAGGYAVYGFDHRGHGRSPGKRGHVDAFADFREDVGRFRAHIQAEAPAAPLFLFGHSMGGLIAVDAGAARFHRADRRDRLGAAAGASRNVSPILLTIAGLLSRIAPTFALDTKLDPATIANPAEVQRYVRSSDAGARSASSNMPICSIRRTSAAQAGHISTWPATTAAKIAGRLPAA